MLSSFFAYCLLSFASPSPATTSSTVKLQYVVLHEGQRVGQIHATKSTQGDATIYEVVTEMNLKILLNQKVNYSSRATYKQGFLHNGSSVAYVNDKLHNSCTTTWKDNRYEIRKDKNIIYHNRRFDYSGTLLYFHEPARTTHVYSEMAGQVNTIRNTGTNLYTLTDTKSKKQNKYRYRNGILEQAHIDHALIDLEIRRIR